MDERSTIMQSLRRLGTRETALVLGMAVAAPVVAECQKGDLDACGGKLAPSQRLVATGVSSLSASEVLVLARIPNSIGQGEYAALPPGPQTLELSSKAEDISGRVTVFVRQPTQSSEKKAPV